ncbi:MAG: nucleoside-diphosphate kinase [Paludibacter sp.]|nr:nucleoside-diphosphate kinase [Paludibacter sp.]
MEKTLVIIKPGAIQRGLIGEVVRRFEQKGLQICGLKMVQLTDELLAEHYAHIAEKPFFPRVKAAMKATPVIVLCLKGMDAVHVVHRLAGATNGREAAMGTMRGDYSMSVQWNIIHTSDSIKTADLELNRFFKEEEIFDYKQSYLEYIYSEDEIV